MKFPHLYRVVNVKDIREEFNYALVKQDFTYATDAHILVRHKTNLLFDDVFISNIPKQGIMLNHFILKALCTKNVIRAELFGQVLILRSKNKSKYPDLSYELPDHLFDKFPDYEKVIYNEEDAMPIKCILLTPELLHKAALAIDPELPFLHLYFKDARKGILVKPRLASDYFGAIGIVMPYVWE